MTDIEKVINSIKACAHHPNHDCASCDYCSDNFWCFNDQLIADFEGIIEQLKKIVNCKECKYAEMSPVSYPQYWCVRDNAYVNDNYFCGKGERKSE